MTGGRLVGRERARLFGTDRDSVTGPQRRCVGCRRSGARSVLLRFVVVEVEGVSTIVLDQRRALPGRGAWLHPDLDCWEHAMRRSALARALRSTARIDQVGIRAALTALMHAEDERPETGV